VRGRLALALLAVTAACIVVFSLFPDLDLWVARALLGSDGLFLGQNSYLLNWLHEKAVPWMVKLCLAFFVLTLLAWLFGRSIAGISAKEALFVIAVFAIGPGLLANTLAKDHSGRPRPTDARPFGGPFAYAAPFAFDGACPNNCSFVSGDAAAGFGFLAPAALLPPGWRRRGIVAALALGGAIGLMRMLQGGHFLSDVIFAGLLVAATTLAIHWAMFRAPGRLWGGRDPDPSGPN
jgi:lipid A 4'-phosphatase